MLDNMEGQEVALEFLESLANDVGILAVMEKHKYDDSIILSTKYKN